MLSKSCQYVVQAIIYIAVNQKEKKYVGLIDISESQKIPKPYLSKLLQILVKGKILISVRGPRGGFCLTKSPDKINLSDIIKQIDGLDVFETCAIGFKVCSDKTPCPIHHEYKIVKDKMKKLFKETSLEDLINDINSGKSFVTYYK